MKTLELQKHAPVSGNSSGTTVLDVQVCVLTYKRPNLLRLTLESLLRQRGTQMQGESAPPIVRAHSRLSLHILIIDNDEGMSGLPVYRELVDRTEVPLRYVSEPARGIAGARNRALHESQGMDLVAFIDDDETADAEWLVRLVDTMLTCNADVVTGPVVPHHEDSPEWVKRGGFFDPVKRATGAPVPFVATNNVLLRGNIVKHFRFDPRFNATGGEDTEFFMRIQRAGRRVVWAREAVVTETIPAERATLRWLLHRARSDANRHTRSCLSFDRGPQTVVRRLFKAVAGFLTGLALLPLGIAGRHHAVRGLQLIFRSIGTISALGGRTDIYYGPSHG